MHQHGAVPRAVRPQGPQEAQRGAAVRGANRWVGVGAGAVGGRGARVLCSIPYKITLRGQVVSLHERL